jgi:hypothetical protein
VDKNRDHEFEIDPWDPTKNEILTMTPDGSGGYTKTLDFDAGEGSGYGYFFRFIHNGDTFLLPPETMLYTTNMNNRIKYIWAEAAGGWYFMDPADTTWANILGERVSYLTNNENVSGIYFDNASCRWKYFDCLDFKYGEDDSTWLSNANDLLGKIDSMIDPKLVFICGLDVAVYEHYLDNTDGFTNDIVAPWNRLLWSSWSSYLDAVIDVTQNVADHKACLFVNRFVPEDSTSERIFCLASYLLCKGDSTYVYYTDSLIHLAYYPEFNIQIGSPTEYEESVDYYFDTDDSVYIRNFTNGKTIVNFWKNGEETTRTVQFDSTFYMVVPEGGFVFNGGKLKYYPDTMVTLDSSTAAIFLKYPYPADTSNATGMNNQRKLIIGDSGEVFTIYDTKGTVRFADMEEGDSGEVAADTVLYFGSFPAMVRKGDCIYGVWRYSNKILCDYFHVDSTSWLGTAPYILDSVPSTPISHITPPSLAIDNSPQKFGHLVYGVFTDPAGGYPGNIIYKLCYRKFQYGTGIIESATLDSVVEYATDWTSDLELGCASIAICNDDTIVVVWSRPIGAGKDTIYIKQQTASGWPSDPDTVSSSNKKSNHPFCDVVDDTVVHIVWEEDDRIIKYRKKSGSTWSNVETVSNAKNTSRSPQVLDGDICVYTVESMIGNSSTVVYSKKSIATGMWGAPVTIESTNARSEHPQAFITSSPFGRTIYAVWTEGNSEPFHIRHNKKIVL